SRFDTAKILFHGGDDRRATAIERLLAGFLLRKADDHFVVAGGAELLDLGVVEAGIVHGVTDFGVIHRVHELHVHLGAAAKIHAPRHAVPKQERDQTGNAKYQREAEEIPVLPEKIDVCAFKEFQNLAF